MKRFATFLSAMACVLWNCGCQTESPAPMTPAVVTAGARGHSDEATLHQGRTLFVSRCVECHTLPAVSSHSAADWPRLIDEMAGRADLKADQRKAVLAYVLAVRTAK